VANGQKSSAAGWLKVELMGITFLNNQGCQQAGKTPSLGLSQVTSHCFFGQTSRLAFWKKPRMGLVFFVTFLARFFCLVHSKKCQAGIYPAWLSPVTFDVVRIGLWGCVIS